jgi:hypothetical protein
MSVLQTSEKVFRVFKFLGYIPITIKNGRSVTKFIFLASIASGFGVLFLSFKYRETLMTGSSRLVELGNFFIYNASISIALVHITHAFANRHKIWNMMIEVNEIDSIFRLLEIKECSQNGRKVSMAIFAFLSLTIPVAFVFYKFDGSIIKLAIYVYSGSYYLLCCGCVIGLAKAIQDRLSVMNDVCESMVETRKGLKVLDKLHNDAWKIQKLILIYSKLTKVVDEMNFCYGFPAMLGVGLTFFYTIFTLFMSCKVFITFGALNDFSIAALVADIYFAVFMMVQVLVCVQVENEAKKILRTSNEVIKRSKDELKIALMMSLSSMVKRRIPKFSCGLFDFDWSLIYSVSSRRRETFKVELDITFR